MVSHSFETVVVEAPWEARSCNTSCALGCTTANRRNGFPGPTSSGAATTCSWEPVKDANVFLSSALLKNEPPMAGERRCRIFLHGDTAANPPQAAASPRLLPLGFVRTSVSRKHLSGFQKASPSPARHRRPLIPSHSAFASPVFNCSLLVM